MRLPPTTTPISDAARYFSKRERDTKQQKQAKSKARDFRYPSFEKPEYQSNKLQGGFGK